MKNTILLVGLLLITACTTTPQTPLEVKNSFNCIIDNFAKMTECSTQNISDNSNLGSYVSMRFSKYNNKLLIRGRFSTSAGVFVKDEVVTKVEKALDSDGKTLMLENVKESRATLCMDGRCYMNAPFDIVIDEEWLQKHKENGVSIKVYTSDGDSRIQRIPAFYIQGFLDYIK